MRETYCFECRQKAPYRVGESVETFEFKEVRVEALQKHAFCMKCGEEVTQKSYLNSRNQKPILFPTKVGDFYFARSISVVRQIA